MVKNKSAWVWVVTGHSESGDDFGPFVFSKAPTEEQLEKLAYDCDGDEYRDGPGDYGSYVFLTTSKVKIDSYEFN